MRNNTHLITEHRNIEIFYDEDKEKFVCDIAIGDNFNSTERGKLKDVKKFIDDYIKKNADFKPFKVMNIDFGYGDSDSKDFKGDCDVYTVTGVRKDGALIIENEKGNRKYFKQTKQSFDNIKSLRVYSTDLLELEEDWKIESKRHQAKLKELSEKAKPFITTINTDFIKTFTD